MHSPTQRTLRARAKLNVLLHILERDTSGYHGIETIYQRLALHDLVHVSLDASKRSLNCDGPVVAPGALGAPEHNLAWRAASAYADAAAWDTGWHIAIEKHIPVGGGLGGGSADAAAVLRAMHSLCPFPIAHDALLAIAGSLGADVPFLFSDIPRAIAWGRGERMLELPALPPTPVALVTFPVGMNTGAAYLALARERERETQPYRVTPGVYDADALASWSGTACFAMNDFERVVSRLHEGVRTALPVLDRAAATLRSSGTVGIARLTGSGATCFLLAADRSEARVDDVTPPSGGEMSIDDRLQRVIDVQALPSDAVVVYTTTA